jgi:Prenyltransferase and squalene oxidase repeat
MPPVIPSMLADTTVVQRLLKTANASGGWGYYASKSSRLEPTVWAVAALAPRGYDLDSHRRFLLGCQRESGLLVENPALPPNVAFNASAAVVMLAEREQFGDGPIQRLLAALGRQAGQRADQTPHLRQDNSLVAWSWLDGAFSWVEPTAWAVLALKIGRRAGLATANADQRIAEAERFLIDRACPDGGWNYGNSNVFGKNLYPYVWTTAITLLALQDKRDWPVVANGLKFLETDWRTESSTISLGLTAICLRRFDRAIDIVEERLRDIVKGQQPLDNAHATAVAAYATLPPEYDRAFAV